MRMSRARMAAALVIALLAVASGGGCRDSNPDGAPAATTPVQTAPSTSPTSDPRAIAVQRAVEAYRGMWTAYQKAGETANADDPNLAIYAIDGALQTLVNGLRSIRDRGLITKGQIVLSPQVTEVQPADRPTTIEITDCADDSKALLYRKSGELFNDKPGGRRLVIATVKDTGGGTWKVTSFGARGVGTC